MKVVHGGATREHARSPHRVEQTVDVPLSQIQEHIVEGVQELVLFRTKSRSWTCRVPDQGHAARVRLRTHF